MAYLGGGETSVAATFAFLFLMVQNPEAQRRAQVEIDRLTNQERVPDFDDREALPYVEAVVRETYRRYPVAPMGVPHRTIQEDEYHGMRIPKGATVMANIWALVNDKEVYPDPDKFHPDRYMDGDELDTKVPDPRFAVFGFGRRVCPGRHFADASVWITAVTLLACFDIGKAHENGVEVDPKEELRSGVVTTLLPFRCSFKPRSEHCRLLIQKHLEELDSSA